MRRLTTTTLLAAFVLLLVQSADAQSLRSATTFYVAPNFGVSNYIGDIDETPADFENTEFFDEMPYSLGIEVGYNTSTRFSVGGAYRVSNFPSIVQSEEGYSRRHMASLVLRYNGNTERRLAPYVQGGLFGVVGQTLATSGVEEDQFGAGPWAGLGLDYVVSPNASIFVGANSRMVVPDAASDGVGSDDDSRLERFDVLSDVNFGLRYRFKPAY